MRVVVSMITCITAVGLVGSPAPGTAHASVATTPTVSANTAGSLDTSFNETGMVETSFGDKITSNGHSVALQKDGKIVAAGCALSVFGGSSIYA